MNDGNLTGRYLARNRVRVEDGRALYGTKRALSRALGVSPQLVSDWGEGVDLRWADHARIVTAALEAGRLDELVRLMKFNRRQLKAAA